MPPNRTRHARRGHFAASCVVFALLAMPALAGAATFEVNTTSDNPPSPGECQGTAGDCSLRQAIDAADVAGGANTITLPAGEYALTLEPQGGDGIESGDLNVTAGSLTINGAGARKSIVDASAIEDRVFKVGEDVELSLSGLTVTGGHTSGSGGGIYGAEEGSIIALDGVAVTDNETFEDSWGGGIYSEDGTLEIVDSTVSGNRDSGDGGGIATEDDELLLLENSTVADNRVDTSLYPSNPSWGAYGGGVEVSTEALVMRNVTISGNEIIDGNGGNQGDGAGIEVDEDETAEIVNTLIADNTGSQVEEPGQCNKPLLSSGHNLESPEPAGEPRCFEEATDLIADPLLGPLADNGGETDTVALGAGSPAIDAGDPAHCPATDQRGYPRPAGAGCDIGAYEVEPEPPVNPPSQSGGNQTAASGGTETAAPKPIVATFSVKKVEALPKTGEAALTLDFSAPGRVKVTGKGLKTVSKKVGAGKTTVMLVPKGALVTKLEKLGKVKMKITAVFTPATGAPLVRTRKITLRLAS